MFSDVFKVYRRRPVLQNALNLAFFGTGPKADPHLNFSKVHHKRTYALNI